MIALLAPSKTMDFTSEIPVRLKTTVPGFMEQTGRLIDRLAPLSADELSALMKMSLKLAGENLERYRAFSHGKAKDRLRPAIFAFTGDVYKGFNAESMTPEELQNAEDSVRILSGLYGLLSPLTEIEPYRLEMGLKIDIGDHSKIAAFWKDAVTESLNTLLGEQQERIIIDLASAEYMAAINKKKLEGIVIDIVFKEDKNGTLKTVPVHSKRARGMMARYIANKGVQKPEELKAFQDGGYRYQKKLSDDKSYVFSRPSEK